MTLLGPGARQEETSGFSPEALSGRRVLELADEKGLYCGKLLADLGADVIKIERPGGDKTRYIPPFWKDQPGPNTGLFFLYMNTNKRGITLDITQPEGKDLFKRLVASSDVVIETFPPGYLSDLGLGYDVLRAINPGVVFTSITNFGQTGPHSAFKSSDLIANALSGIMHVTGEEEDPPSPLGGVQAYVVSSLFGAVSSLFALFHRSAGGLGQQIDISMQEAMISVSHICGVYKWLEDDLIPRRWGNKLFAAPTGTYPCKDGHVYLMINRPPHWVALAKWINEVTGNEEVLLPRFEGPSSNRLPHRDLLDVYVCDLTAHYTVEEFYREGQRLHIPITPVNTIQRVCRDAQLAAREFFVKLEHPQLGPLRYPGAPYRHSETPWRLKGSAPEVGQHNREIMGDELGLSSQGLDALHAAGVV